MSRPAILLAGLALAGCTGPSHGTMTHDEAMDARSGLTRVDRVPLDAAPARGSMRPD